MSFSGPYIADRDEVARWAENGDAEARQYLATPGVLFGVDDGKIQAWFQDRSQAEEWLLVMLADDADKPAR